MSKQTAVEWLWEQIDGIIPYQDINTNQRFIGVLEQAKAMEKEQIMEAYLKNHLQACWMDKKENEFAEQYYKETYGGGEE